jgi:hypothetical protein
MIIRLFSIIVLVFSVRLSYGQEDLQIKTQPIVDEGKSLYRSEMASWYGTDLFLEQFKTADKIGGYFSYPYQNRECCIFFSKGDNPVVIGTISFDSTYTTQNATVDLSQRAFSSEESDIYTFRANALKIIRTDTLFKSYANTELNLIPVMTPKERKVYVLTGPSGSGMVIFGNDYLLTFDLSNQLITKRALHKNIMVAKYSTNAADTSKVVGAMHSHVPETGDFITATDICTLMLYEKFAKWEWYYVFSKNYVCIWNCQNNQLLTLTKEAFDKISKSPEGKSEP